MIANLKFRCASVYSLAFPDNGFDRTFSHALIEHLSRPLAAVAELRRVTKPGGYLGLCSPHWPAFVLTPSSPDVVRVMERYTELQRENGGDPEGGGRLGGIRPGHGLGPNQAWRGSNVMNRYP